MLITIQNKRKWTMMVLLMLLSLWSTNTRAQKKKWTEWLVEYLDSSNVKGTDPNYIQLAPNPWALVLNVSSEQMRMSMDSYFESNYNGVINKYDLNLKIDPPFDRSIGLWAGYRGWGLGYSLALSDNKATNFLFNFAGASFGFNVSYKNFEVGELMVKLDDIDETTINLAEPMKIRSLMLDGYWIFNRKRFSLAAAYDQSIIQKRSAGSVIAGAMYFYQNVDYSQPRNFLIPSLTNDVGKMKVQQGGIGVGYTYNWVPVKGLVANIVCMPVISFYNKADVYRYEMKSDMDFKDITEENLNDHVWMEETDADTNKGRVRLNIDTRFSIAYWYKNCFIRLMGQGHQFESKYRSTTVNTIDWHLKASVGYSF